MSKLDILCGKCAGSVKLTISTCLWGRWNMIILWGEFRGESKFKISTLSVDPTLRFDPQPTLTPHDALAGILHYFKQHTIAILCVKGLIPHPLNIGLMQSVLIRNLTPHLTKISALCIRVDVRYMCKMMNEIFQIPTDLLTVFLPKYKRRQP